MKQETVRKLRLLPLLAGVYYMVAGGPQGLEDILGMAGYGRSVLILVLLPFFWSIPTALMIGELASAIPEEGGFYAWVKRAMGPFWGFQEGWLSLAASIFDMAIYPTIFVEYISRIAPVLGHGWWPLAIKLSVIICAVAWNLRGAYSVGEGSVKMMFLGLSPFVALILFALWYAAHHHAPAFAGRPSTYTFSGAMLVAMWNYMGWDNASTIAGEVENPRRNYPRAMLTAAFMTMATYTIPICVLWAAGVNPEGFTTGSWVDAGRMFGGPALAVAIAVAVSMDSLGNFTSLTMSFTRLPYAMAEDGLLPKALTKLNKNGVPWVSILVCGTLWACALGLTFERLITVDLVLWGGSLMVEFAALVILRVREPHMERPFKIPGGVGVACALGLGPAVLIAYALWASRDEKAYGMSALVFSVLIAALGPVLYWVFSRMKRAATDS